MSLSLIFLSSIIIWISGELYVYLLLTKKDGEIDDKGSSRLLEIGTAIIIGITIFLQLYRSIGVIDYLWVSYLGLMITTIGVLYRQYSIYVLGNFFSGYLRIKNGHHLIQHGPYKFFRHPSYFGSVISYLGIGLASSNLISTLLLPVGISILYIYRIKVEEEMMYRSFGEEYQNYKERTWGFLPFIK